MALSNNKKFLFFGAGAIGSFYGGMLVKAGHNVIFISRGENYKVLKRDGLTLIIDNKEENYKINVFDSTNNIGVFEYVFICVKSFDTKFAVDSIKENIAENTIVASFQNGVDNEEIISSTIGQDKIIGAVVVASCRLIRPGVVKHYTLTGGLIGELDCKKTKRIYEVQNILKNAGLDFIISDNIKADLWNKLAWNTTFNSISTLTSKTIDQIINDSELYNLSVNILTEVKNVAIAQGINIRTDTVEFNIERSKPMVGFKTSMLQDYEAGKPLEIEGLIGVVIRKAKEKNVKVSNTEKIYSQLKEMLKVTSSDGRNKIII